MKQNAWIIFTRVPLPGQTKTRLMPYFTPTQCAALHCCMLKDLRSVKEKVKADLFVAYTPGEKGRMLQRFFGSKVHYFPQEGESMGERMYRAFCRVKKRGYERVVLTGSDIPELSAADISDAFRQLKKKDVVLGKTWDGGYYLIGMKQIRQEIFELPGYGHGHVAEDTVAQIHRLGLSLGYTKSRYDLDEPKDIQLFRDRMRKRRALSQTRTGKYLLSTLRISIIVPIYNEEKTIVKMTEQLMALKDRCEILLVDGGSTDRTRDLIPPELTLLRSEKGRAEQMNCGAKHSTGDILFFLHCDSILPERPLYQIKKVMKHCRAGCFGIAFRSRNFFMWTCGVISNHRIKDRKIMFGDQGIFIDRALFFEVGMFPALPIMEDYQFSLTLKERGEKLGITEKRIYTSHRRFPEGTIPKLRLMWKMNRMRKMYRDGVDIHMISQMYRDVR